MGRGNRSKSGQKNLDASLRSDKNSEREATLNLLQSKGFNLVDQSGPQNYAYPLSFTVSTCANRESQIEWRFELNEETKDILVKQEVSLMDSYVAGFPMDMTILSKTENFRTDVAQALASIEVSSLEINEYGIGEFQKPSIPDVSEVKERLKRVLYREEMKSFLELERIKRVEEALEKQEKSKEAKINAENKIAEYNFNL